MRQTDPRVSHRLYHPLPILTQHPSGGSWINQKEFHDAALRRHQKKVNDCKNIIKKDEEREQTRQQLRERMHSGGMVGPEWTWKRGGSWKSKWYLTPGQNRKRRNKLRAQCMRDISGGHLFSNQYLNNCKSIMETSNYLRAVRMRTDAIKARRKKIGS
jgi:hypothetical protein